MSLEKAKIGDAIYDITTIEELDKNPDLYGQYTAVTNNDGYLYPLRSRNDYRPGLYRTGCMDLYVPPQGNERPMYSQQNIINFKDATTLKEIIQTQQKLASEERTILTSIDNLFSPEIGDNDTPEMKAMKEAINLKHIDIDKYEPRFGPNFNNDKRLLKKDSITFRKLKDVCEALDMKATLKLEDANPNVPNPIGHAIIVDLTTSFEGDNDNESK